MKKIAINGTGRIGLCVARIIGRRKDIEIGAINTTTDIDTLVHLIRYDSVHGFYEVKKLDDNTLEIGNSKNVKIISNRDIDSLDFSPYGVEAIIECTGKFNSLEKSSAHLKNGIKKVIISAPAENAPTFVYGVNHQKYNGESVISNASCTTNCLAPILQVLHQNFGIESGLMTTIHSYTNDQNLLDNAHPSDKRRSRAAAMNIIPTTTGAAKNLYKVLPTLEGKLHGHSVRVPTANVSMLDLNLNLKQKISIDSLHELFASYASHALSDGGLAGILTLDEKFCVSSDFIGDTHSCIIAKDLSFGVENLVKIMAWYDNEWGYSNRIIELARYIMQRD